LLRQKQRESTYLGRKLTVQAKSDRVLELIGQGLTKKAVASEMDTGVTSVYRVLKSA